MPPALVRPYVRVIAHHQISPSAHPNSSPVAARPVSPLYHPRHSWTTFVDPAAPAAPRPHRVGNDAVRRFAGGGARRLAGGGGVRRSAGGGVRRFAGGGQRSAGGRTAQRRGPRHYPALAWTVLLLTLATTGLALMASDRPAASDAEPLTAAQAGRLQIAVVPAPTAAAPASPAPVAAAAPVGGPLVGPAGLCLDARSGGTVQLRRCTGVATQTWTAPADGTLRTDGRCLQPTSGHLGMARCTGAAAQQWDTAKGRLVARSSRQCLTGKDGAQPYLARCAGTTGQRWQLP